MLKTLLALSFALIPLVSVRSDDWPQWRGPQRDGVWRETGIVQHLPVELTYRWRTPIGGGFAGPAVVGKHVYVTDRVLPSETPMAENRPLHRETLMGGERVLCLDADSGEVLWAHEYPCRYNISFPAGPRATPTVHKGKVYSLGAMGDLLCLDAETGKPLWKKNFVEDFGAEINLWGMAAAPLIDGDRIILLVGGRDNAAVVALHKDTGKEIWRALEAADPGYSAPVIVQVGGRRQLIIRNPVGIYGLDPKTGSTYWQHLAKVRMGHSVATPVFDAERKLLFVTSFFDGPMMMKLSTDAAARLVWKGNSQSELPQNTDGLHSIISTPVLQDGYIYGVCSYGQLRCLEAATGKRIWETLEATGKGRWSTAFLVKHQDRFFICNEQGELIIASLSPKGYAEQSRAPLIEPTNRAGRRKVVWSHPAFANRCIYARNDKEIVCVDMSADVEP